MSFIGLPFRPSDRLHQPQTQKTILSPQRAPPPAPTSKQPKLSQEFPSSCEKEANSTDPKMLVQRTEDHPSFEENLSPLLSEFQRLFHKFDYASVRNDILERQLLDSNFATVLWRIFLHCLPRDPCQWDEMLQTSRSHYEKIYEQYQIDPYKMIQQNNSCRNINHPLSQDENSCWTQYFADEMLRETISMDVRRTYPDILFFRNPRMAALQLRILYTHTRRNEKLTPYRQGMHEILGIIVYCLYMEGSQVNQCADANALMKNLYDSQYLEHDAYAIFEKMMNHLREFYSQEQIDSPTTKQNKKKGKSRQSTIVSVQTNKTVYRINSLFKRFPQYDTLLYCKLKQWNIEPTIYGTRWLRLLFAREISFESIPSLWTVIFCFDEHFGFVDYFFLALLKKFGRMLNIKEFTSDSDCLQLLMQQNAIDDPESVIRAALHIGGRELVAANPEPVVLPIRRAHEDKNDSKQSEPQNETPRARELQRVPIVSSPGPRLMRPYITNFDKSSSPLQTNHAAGSSKSVTNENTPSTSSSNTKNSNFIIEYDMNVGCEKTIRERYDENVQLQKCCAQYMYQFIDHLQNLICDLKAPNEDELLVQVSGLKQIASIIDGKLTFDHASLQAPLNYKTHEKPSQINSNNMN